MGKEFIKYENTYLAFLDILGLSQLIKCNNISTIEDFFNRWNDDFFEKLSFPFQYCAKFETVENDKGEKLSKLIGLNIVVRVFSDSVIIWTKGYTKKEFDHLINVILDLNEIALNLQIPFRGAISCGWMIENFTIQTEDMSINNIFGSALVRAVEMEKNQNWFGIQIDNVNIDDDLIKSNRYIIEYNNAFLKNKEMFSEKTFVLKTSLSRRDGVQMTADDVGIAINKLFTSYNKSIDSSDVQEKIRNTIEFYEYTSLPTETIT